MPRGGGSWSAGCRWGTARNAWGNTWSQAYNANFHRSASTGNFSFSLMQAYRFINFETQMDINL